MLRNLTQNHGLGRDGWVEISETQIPEPQASPFLLTLCSSVDPKLSSTHPHQPSSHLGVKKKQREDDGELQWPLPSTSPFSD